MPGTFESDMGGTFKVLQSARINPGYNMHFFGCLQRFHLRSTRKTKVEWGLVSLAHNLRKYVVHKAEMREKEAQSMVMQIEKPILKAAV